MLTTNKVQGHKRWDKAVSGGYESIRRLTHECLLPALERSQVLLSRLVGLSKFHKLSDVLGLDTPKLKAIVETLDCLHLLAHNVLKYANEELGQFNAFSKWLRHEIAILNSEPLSQTLEENLEKRDVFDVPPTVKYITGALRKSVLRNFIRQLPMLGVPQPPTPVTDKWLPDGHDQSFYDTFKSLLQQQRQVQTEGGDSTTVDAPRLNDLTKRLGVQFDKVFADIALTQRRGILHRSPLTLHADCDEGVSDLRICYEVSWSIRGLSVLLILSPEPRGGPPLFDLCCDAVFQYELHCVYPSRCAGLDQRGQFDSLYICRFSRSAGWRSAPTTIPRR